MLIRFVRELVLCWALLGAPVPAHALAPLPPGLEPEVERLFEGPRNVGAFKFTALRITQLAVEVKLSDGSDTAVFHLLPRDEDGFGAKAGETKSFSVWLVSEELPKVLPVGKQLVERLAARDDGSFYVKANALRGDDAPAAVDSGDRLVVAHKLGFLDDARRALTWGALLALLGWTLVAALRQRKVHDVAWWVGLVVVTAVGISLRFKLPPWAPLHANMHGIAEVRGLSGNPGTWIGPVETDRYGVAYGQIVRTVIGLWSGDYRSALGFAAVAGGLGVLAMGLFVAVLIRNRWAGLLAAVALALHPAHVALSVSESPMPLAMTLWLVALGAIAAMRDAEGRARTRLAWVAALALSCAVELSIPTLFLVPATALAVILWRVAVLRSWPMAVVSLTTGLHVIAVWPVLTHATEARGVRLSESMVKVFTLRPTNILFDGSLTSSVLVPLAIVGLLVLLWRRKIGVALSLVGMAVIVLVPALAVVACRTDFIRYQTISHLALIGLAAAPLMLVQRFSWWVQLPVVAGGVAAFVVTGLPGLRNVQEPVIEAKAFQIAEAALKKLPKDTTIQIAPRRMGQVLNDFPEFVARGERLTVEDSPAAGGNCAVWIGPACYSFTDAEIASGMAAKAHQVGEAPIRAECTRLLAQVDAGADPVAAELMSVPHADAEFHRIPGKQLLIGLFPCARAQGLEPVASPD